MFANKPGFWLLFSLIFRKKFKFNASLIYIRSFGNSFDVCIRSIRGKARNFYDFSSEPITIPYVAAASVLGCSSSRDCCNQVSSRFDGVTAFVIRSLYFVSKSCTASISRSIDSIYCSFEFDGDEWVMAGVTAANQGQREMHQRDFEVSQFAPKVQLVCGGHELSVLLPGWHEI